MMTEPPSFSSLCLVYNEHKLTSPSYHCQSTITHNKCAIVLFTVQSLPLTSIIFQDRHATTRCFVLPHHSTCLETSQCASATTNGSPPPKAPPIDSRWLILRPKSTPQVPQTTSPSRHLRQIRISTSLHSGRNDAPRSRNQVRCSRGPRMAPRSRRG